MNPNAARQKSIASRSLIASLLALSLAACSAVVETSGQGGEQQAEQAQGDEAVSRPDSGCTKQWPIRLEVGNADSDDEDFYDDFVPVCANRAQTSSVIINDSEAVWIFVSDIELAVTPVSSDRDSTLFRETVDTNSLYSYAFLAPNETARLPDEIMSDQRARDGFEWHISPSLTATWLAQDVYVAAVEKLGKKALTAAFARDSAGRKALIACTFAFSDAASIGTISAENTTQDDLLAALGAAAGFGTCASSWRSAVQEAGDKRFPTLLAGVETAGTISGNIVKVNKGWSFLLSLCAAAPRFC